MHLIVYTSHFIGQESEINSILEDIGQYSKVNNLKDNITGVLFFHKGRFIQILEGNKIEIDRLLAKLALDSRHENIEILIDANISSREFLNWNMSCFNLSDQKTINRNDLIEITQAFKKLIQPDAKSLADIYTLMITEGIFINK